MIKKTLVKRLEAVPDDAIVVFFSGDETTEIATEIIVHRPTDDDFCSPHPRVGSKTWMELSRNWRK